MFVITFCSCTPTRPVVRNNMLQAEVLNRLQVKFLTLYYLSLKPWSVSTSLHNLRTKCVEAANKSQWLKSKQACAVEMTVRYAALCACRKVHVCHCNSLGGATWRSVIITGRTDRQTDRQSATHYAAPSYGGGPHNKRLFLYRSRDQGG